MFLIPQSQCSNVCSISKTGSLLRFDLHKGGEPKGTIMCVLLNLHHIQHSIIIVISRYRSQVLLSIERDIELKWCDLMSKVRRDPDPKTALTEVDIKVVKCLCYLLSACRLKDQKLYKLVGGFLIISRIATWKGYLVGGLWSSVKSNRIPNHQSNN